MICKWIAAFFFHFIPSHSYVIHRKSVVKTNNPKVSLLLYERLAEKRQDASLWTPKDALEFALKESEKLKMTKMVIIYQHDVDGSEKIGYCSAGTTSKNDEIGMVSTHLHLAIKDTFGET